MGSELDLPLDAGAVLTELRDALKLTQASLAQASGVDQSRISRIEKGEIAPIAEINRLLEAMIEMGSSDARSYAAFIKRAWLRIDRPLFRNPQRPSLELADETLAQIDEFLDGKEGARRPWPLVRQIEKQRDAIRGAAAYLQSTSHQIAFIGDIGVGKSTAINFLFNLLTPVSTEGGPLDRVVLETGSGRTTVCEVHLRRGPEYGVYIQPQGDAELRGLVSDFCAGIWLRLHPRPDGDGAVRISEEIGRAIRNMAALTVKPERLADGRRQSRDAALEFAKSCDSEEEFRARVIDRMQLGQRVRHEIWHESVPAKSPLQWMAETFKKINNGRLADVPLPRSIDLLFPNFAADMAPLEVAVVDTKGIDDIAVRPDLDLRLKDPRTLVVLCSSFNDAPCNTAKLLLKHLGESLAERIEGGRVAILALPRPGEAMKVKDDAGNPPEDDFDGYELKRDQIERVLGGDSLSGAPVLFFNAASDPSDRVRRQLFDKLSSIREAFAERILELAATVEDLIKNHEAQAFAAAVEEVAGKLRRFLHLDRKLRSRKRHAYEEVMRQLDLVRYASTVWAATRRSGDWYGFDVCHHLGVGASTDALLRCKDWFAKLGAHIELMKADPGLVPARRILEQIERSAETWARDFVDAARTAGSEAYREQLQQDSQVWSQCSSEWGAGPGFKHRVKQHLREWFEEQDEAEENLEAMINACWKEQVIQPIERLCNEETREPDRQVRRKPALLQAPSAA